MFSAMINVSKLLLFKQECNILVFFVKVILHWQQHCDINIFCSFCNIIVYYYIILRKLHSFIVYYYILAKQQHIKTLSYYILVASQ